MAEKNNKILNVPHLRFPEFKDEWNKVKLGEVTTDINYGLNLPSKEFNGKTIYIRITDIDESSRTLISSGFTSPDGELNENLKVAKNDILIARTGASTGKSFIFDNYNFESYFAGFLIRFRPKIDFNPHFLFYNLNTSSFGKFIKIMSARSGQPGINSEEYKSYSFSVPSLNEQNKVSLFIRAIDNRIEIQRKLIESYKSLIKSLNDDLYVVASKDTFKLKNIVLPLQAKEIENDNYLEIGDINVSTGLYRVDENKKWVNGAQKGYCNNLIISTVRPTRGATTILKQDIMISSALLQLNIIKSYDATFIKEYLRTPKVLNDFSNLSFGSTYPTISKGDLLNYKIPRLETTELILKSRMVSSASNLLDHLQGNVESFTLLKEYLLENLFI